MTMLSGPMFEPSTTDLFRKQPCLYCRRSSEGAHYSLFQITGGIDALKQFFPDAKANEMNFVLFSSSGVHGSYTTIEQIEESLQKYGDLRKSNEEEWPEDYRWPDITVQIVQPRICCLRYGNINITLEDIPYLKQLRQSSWDAVRTIGAARE